MHRALSILLRVFVTLASTQTQAAKLGIRASGKFAYPAQHFSLQGVRDIKIIGVRGHVKLQGRSGKLMTLKVKQSSSHKAIEDWNLSLEKRGSTLFLEVANLTYGKEWRKQVREDQWPEFDIELEGPARPTLVSWREGLVEFNQWDGNLELSLLKGVVKVQGGRGGLRMQPASAEIDVRNRKGAIALQGETGKAWIQDTEGPLDLNWFNGDLTVQGGKGQLTIEMPKGKARIDNYQGSVKINGQETQWNILAAAPADLNIVSLSGPVELKWSGGAQAFLTSTLGSLEGPAFLQKSEREGRQIWQGHKNGKSTGQIFVRTSSGHIRWRQ